MGQLGRDRFLVQISRNKQQTFPDCGQKHLGVLHFLPGQNKLNLQFTESSAGSGSSLCAGRTCCGREEEIPGCYSAVFTAPDSMAFRNEGFDVAQHTHAVICLSALSKFIGIVKSCLTQWENMDFIPGDGVEHFDSLKVSPEKHELPFSPHLLGNYCTSLKDFSRQGTQNELGMILSICLKGLNF